MRNCLAEVVYYSPDPERRPGAYYCLPEVSELKVEDLMQSLADGDMIG